MGTEGYGVLGDTRTAALSSPDGSIDWMPVPAVDGDPVFAGLLGAPSSFRLGPEGAPPPTRRYSEGTPVLETRWSLDGSEITLTEGLVKNLEGWLSPRVLLVRSIRVRGRPARIRVGFDPRLGFAARPAIAERRHGALICRWGSLAVALTSDPDLELRPGVEATVRVEPDRPLTMAMTVADREPLVVVVPGTAVERLRGDEDDWRRWSADVAYEGPRRASVIRSLVTLRLLTFSPTGAPVAAPTTSLPEVPGAQLGLPVFVGA